MKKKILYIAAILICLSIITGGTYAYYTTTDTARNVISSGSVDVEVIEQQMVDGKPQPYPSQPIRILPATRVSKIVSLQSTGQSAWVRMKYALVVQDAEGKALEIPAEELANAIIIETDSENWTLKEGWWYYHSAIKDDAVTVPLFEEIIFSGPHMDNKYLGCTLDVVITAQAVQQVHNGSSFTEALWPET